jgi:hypothetical protein
MVQKTSAKLIFDGRVNSFAMGYSLISTEKNANKQCLRSCNPKQFAVINIID